MSNFRVILFCVVVSFGGFLFGWDIGVLSGLLILPDFIRHFGVEGVDGRYVLDANRQSIITSLLSAGTFFGSIAQAFTTDRLGRKYSIFTWSAIFTVGCVIQTASFYSIVQITIGRFIAGLGVGALSAIVPLWVGEAAPRKIRGSLLVCYQLNIIVGLFFSYIVDFAFRNSTTSAGWRVPIGLQIVWGLILCGGILFLPESPRLLLGRGDEEGAARALAKMNGCSIDSPVVLEELDDLNYGLAQENEGGKATWAECFSSRNSLWKRTLNGVMLQFIQQLNGQNFYYYYGPVFFSQSAVTLSPYTTQLLLGGISLAATIPALWAIDGLGRRKLLIWGAIAEAICAIIAGVAGKTMLNPNASLPKDQLTDRNKTGGSLLVAFAVIQISCFSFFWGPTPWVYLGESFPLRVRPKAIALGTASNWFWNFLLGFFAPRIAAKIGPLILLIFAGVLLYGTVYVYFMVPETRGLSLEEVDEQYASGVKPWKSSTWVPPSRAARGEWNDKGQTQHNERGKRRAPVVFH